MNFDRDAAASEVESHNETTDYTVGFIRGAEWQASQIVFSANAGGTGFRREPAGTTRTDMHAAGRRVFVIEEQEGADQ